MILLRLYFYEKLNMFKIVVLLLLHYVNAGSICANINLFELQIYFPYPLRFRPKSRQNWNLFSIPGSAEFVETTLKIVIDFMKHSKFFVIKSNEREIVGTRRFNLPPFSSSSTLPYTFHKMLVNTHISVFFPTLTNDVSHASFKQFTDLIMFHNQIIRTGTGSRLRHKGYARARCTLKSLLLSWSFDMVCS